MNTQKFFDIIEARSNENKKALELLVEAKCYALVGAIIRMELDSFIRTYHFSSCTSTQQQAILQKFFSGEKWSMRDADMIARMSQSIGWTEHIYKFCNAFIHLSPFHDWATSSQIPNLTQQTRQFIAKDINAQQYDKSVTISENFGFEELIHFAPHIFEKLRSNLLYEMNRNETH